MCVCARACACALSPVCACTSVVGAAAAALATVHNVLFSLQTRPTNADWKHENYHRYRRCERRPYGERNARRDACVVSIAGPGRPPQDPEEHPVRTRRPSSKGECSLPGRRSPSLHCVCGCVYVRVCVSEGQSGDGGFSDTVSQAVVLLLLSLSSWRAASRTFRTHHRYSYISMWVYVWAHPSVANVFYRVLSKIPIIIIIVLPTITERWPLICFPIAAYKRDHEHLQRQRCQAERARWAAWNVARLHHWLLAWAAQRHRRLRHRVLRQTKEIQIVSVLYKTAECRWLQRRRRCVRHRLVNWYLYLQCVADLCEDTHTYTYIHGSIPFWLDQFFLCI